MPVLSARGQSPSMAFGHSKSFAFHGSCTPGTSSLRCGRLFVHSLLSPRRGLPIACLCAAVGAMLVAAVPARAEQPWRPLFNGKDLTGWTPKIRGEKVGDNYGNTFRVEDGVLKVVYDRDTYPTFGEKFGHLFHEETFSRYRLRIDYRFTGEQCPGGPGWAVRNSGVMLHGENPAGMALAQDFPASIEVQFLGGAATGERTTANLCTPGTNVVMAGKLFTPHCTGSSSKTYRGDQWVTIEVEVDGATRIRHRIDGQTVLEYEQPQLDERDAHARELIAARGGEKLLAGGTISLQSESHPVEFRRVEIQLLDEPAAAAR